MQHSQYHDMCVCAGVFVILISIDFLCVALIFNRPIGQTTRPTYAWKILYNTANNLHNHFNGIVILVH